MAKKASFNITRQQYLFCLEYVNCNYNGTEAAKKAGYSEKAAAEQASLLLTKTNIQAAIDSIEKDRLEALKITGEWVLKRIKQGTEWAEKKKDLANYMRGMELLGRNKLWDKAGKKMEASVEPDGTMTIKFEEDNAEKGPQE